MDTINENRRTRPDKKIIHDYIFECVYLIDGIIEENVLKTTNKNKSSMENKELYQTLEELRTGQITTNIAMEQILLLFSVVGQSEQLLAFFEHIQREYNIEADITFGEALQSFKSK